MESRTEIEDSFATLLDALTVSDIDGLNELLTEGFLLIDLAGVEHLRRDWIKALKGGDTAFHDVDVVETLLAGGDQRPILTARTIADATLWAVRSEWHLLWRVEYFPREDGWRVGRVTLTSW